MSSYLNSVIKQFKYYRQLGEKTMQQLTDEQLFHQSNSATNSVAVVVKHLWGNMLSRWTDFLESDGEKTTRDRDGEFEGTFTTREEVMEHWNAGWECLLSAIEPLSDDDLERIIYIRNIGHTVIEAINRQLAHYAYHVGQIVVIGKQLRGSAWVSLSIPRNQSYAFNQARFRRDKRRGHFTDDLLDSN